ncbi:MAG TPA: FAD-dependent oxidoreductase [Chlamydiales bacterium]|nr:FAD-dependent oxidoreductase [Chlamydiales bacterium]
MLINVMVTFLGFSDENDLVIDQRGFKTIALTEASSFLNQSDSRVHLGQVVTDITYSPHGIQIETNQGLIVKADYAICTFS